MPRYKHIGQQIKLMRMILGWEQEEVACFLGITKQYLSMVENGHRRLSIGKVKELSVEAHIDIKSIAQMYLTEVKQ